MEPLEISQHTHSAFVERAVWIVEGDCGDYYCDGMHNLGVFDSQDAAFKHAARMSGGFARKAEAAKYVMNMPVDYDQNDMRESNA